ncbi:hypothetical protein RDWZM_000236 [Blomia tropicalis]|uniref:CWF19-like protein 2 n=1 Tax=Blomia tropicalis TaxID=40697 RepID=A0A9Q0RPF2_BLOTA|nr:hypothetical protein RDWZM_000236 [Blomia tropicalis]
MGKHKIQKHKKSKKHKNKDEKSKRKRCDSSESIDSNSSGEIYWAESTSSVTKEPECSSSNVKNKNQNDSPSNNINEENDWLNIIEKSTKSNNKLAQLKRDIRKGRMRELNPFYRKDTAKALDEESQESSENSSENESVEDLEETVEKLSEGELNAINAKIIKAEMLGQSELVEELKAKLKRHANAPDSRIQHYTKKSSKNVQKEKEDDMSVKQMYLQQKTQISSRDEAMRFINATSIIRSADDEYDEVKRRKKKTKLNNTKFEQIVKQESSMQNCGDCLERTSKHLTFKFFEELKHCFVCFTPFEPFILNYCQIRSLKHQTRPNSITADEECWTEIRQLMRQLSAFFTHFFKCSVIFMETHFRNQKRSQNISSKHFVIECVPIKSRLEGDAKIYFHKAILESGEEWAMNRKMVKLEGKPVTKMLPKEFAYFWVSFGPNFNGFAHVIEDEDYFQKDFGKEIIAGLNDIEPLRWKRPKFQDYDAQMKRIEVTRDKWNKFIKEQK